MVIRPRLLVRSAGALVVGVAMSMTTLGVLPAAAQTGVTGPVLTTDPAALEQSLNCHGDLTDPAHSPVVLLHGTTSTSEANWSWGWAPALAAEGRSYCTVDLPRAGMEDIQQSGEYVTYAIREVHQRSGQKVDVVGHSQGGMIGRWTTKWWPDTRLMVDNMVGLGSSTNGSEVLSLLCGLPCPEALRQQSAGSGFLALLNDPAETYPGIRYTTIATEYDEIVTPHTLSFLPEGDNVTNITLQDQCPGEPVEHFLLAVSNPVWSLATQALDGVIDPQVSAGECGKLLPGVETGDVVTNAPSTVGTSVRALIESEWTLEEPEAADYAQRGTS